jgi:hypothetical protein
MQCSAKLSQIKQLLVLVDSHIQCPGQLLPCWGQLLQHGTMQSKYTSDCPPFCA